MRAQTRRSAVVVLSLMVSACGEPAHWRDLSSPWTVCSAGVASRTTMEVRWLNNGRVLELTSEPETPRLRFTRASMFDEYYSGDGYNLEIQIGGVISLQKRDGSELHDC